MDKEHILEVIDKARELFEQDNTVGSRTMLIHAAWLVDRYNDKEAAKLQESCNKTSDSPNNP